MMTHSAFELPFFYAQRFYRGAFDKIHGPKIYACANLPFRIQEWFDKELEIPSGQTELFGLSSANAAVTLADYLGCNPVILLGIDLSYTDSKRYAEGAPADLNPIQKNGISGKNAKGKAVLTRWDWIEEAMHFTKFASTHPHLSLLNATEEGLSVKDVPNVSFQEVVEKHLTQSYDLRNWIHAEWIQATLPINEEAVLEAMEKWSLSLKKCGELLEEEQLTLLQEEPAYQYYLKEWNFRFEQYSAIEWKKLQFFPNRTRKKIGTTLKKPAMNFSKNTQKSISSL